MNSIHGHPPTGFRTEVDQRGSTLIARTLMNGNESLSRHFGKVFAGNEVDLHESQGPDR